MCPRVGLQVSVRQTPIVPMARPVRHLFVYVQRGQHDVVRNVSPCLRQRRIVDAVIKSVSPNNNVHKANVHVLLSRACVVKRVCLSPQTLHIVVSAGTLVLLRSSVSLDDVSRSVHLERLRSAKVLVSTHVMSAHTVVLAEMHALPVKCVSKVSVHVLLAKSVVKGNVLSHKRTALTVGLVGPSVRMDNVVRVDSVRRSARLLRLLCVMELVWTPTQTPNTVGVVVQPAEVISAV